MGPDRWGNGGFVKTLNAKGKVVAQPGAGSFSINNAKGKPLVRMGRLQRGDGFVRIRNAEGVWQSP